MKESKVDMYNAEEYGPCHCMCHEDRNTLHFMPCCAYTYVPRAQAEETAAKLRAEKEKDQDEQKAELKKPEEWEKEVDYKIMDPDGWRNENIPWDQPITKEKFESLAMQSTIKLAGSKIKEKDPKNGA